MIADARHVGEWTCKPLREHRDGDVLRFCIAQRVAREVLAKPEAPNGARVVRRGRTETVEGGSFARYGAAAARATARPRSAVRS